MKKWILIILSCLLCSLIARVTSHFLGHSDTVNFIFGAMYGSLVVSVGPNL